MKKSTYIILFSFIAVTLTFAQHKKTDTMMLNSENLLSHKTQSYLLNSWGMDLIISTNGFGLGIFYGYNFSDELTGKVNLSIAESKDEREMEVYNPYTGLLFTPNKVNRFIVFPLLFGFEYRLFKDEILDNFRPYVSAMAGPSLIFSTPYDIEFFESLKYGKSHYTVSGYIGFGAFFGSDKKNILGVNIRYYIIPYQSGIESMQFVKKKDFGGFSISLSFGTGW